MERFLDNTHCIRLHNREDWLKFVELVEDLGLHWIDGRTLKEKFPIIFPQTIFYYPYKDQFPYVLSRSIFNNANGRKILSAWDVVPLCETNPVPVDELLSILE